MNHEHRGGRVLITGATGRVGGLVIDRLLVEGVPVRALVRNAADASLPAGVEVAEGDLTVPESLDVALEGASTVFLVWTIPFGTAPAVIKRIAARTRRVVLLSSPHQTPHPFFQQPNPAAKLHADLERLIADSGHASTIIRPGIFASNTIPWWSGAIKNGEPVRWPFGAAETAPIDERDVAEVAAQALWDNRHAGADYVLTGPESLSQADQARLIGEAIGRHVEFQELTAEEFRNETAETWPRPVVDMLLDAWQATLGRPAYVTSTVLDVTGSPPRTFARWAADHAGAFRSSPTGAPLPTS
ncbi:MAG TPA: NAD(P)H-binding protein [Mycobacteriales bacterium]|nr:NAD(P)H-binding protein [Mycobacteriales bacterium]